jgi:hypothetical protein
VWALSELMVLSVQPVMPQFGTYGRSVESNHLGQVGGYTNAQAYGVPGQPDSTVYPATAEGFRSMVAAISEQK